jgi:hypothetical protein
MKLVPEMVARAEALARRPLRVSVLRMREVDMIELGVVVGGEKKDKRELT